MDSSSTNMSFPAHYGGYLKKLHLTPGNIQLLEDHMNTFLFCIRNNYFWKCLTNKAREQFGCIDTDLSFQTQGQRTF